MSNTLSHPSRKSGMSPGTLVHVGDSPASETSISLISYNDDSVEEKTIESIQEILPYTEKKAITWVNIEGLKNIPFIEALGTAFSIHPLVLEDILNTHQRPKFEDFDNHQFIVLKGLSVKNGEMSVDYEQISMLIFDNLVITFKEKTDDLFEPLIKRIQNGKNKIRSKGTEYLTYAILDIIVDENFFLLESLDENIDIIEEELLQVPTSETLNAIQNIKRELIYIRRSISPLRELLASILRSEAFKADENMHVYFNDIYDHVLRITESIELNRDRITGLLDIYISSVSNKMNEIMKVLTVFASIFIPLTFIVGIYGMNFEYMPELKWKWAYPTLWVIFIIITVGLLYYFKKKKWL